MKTTVIAVLMALSANLCADERGLRGENRTGAWWKTLRMAEKIPYITGLLDGEFLGGRFAMPTKADAVSRECRAVVKKNYIDRSSVLSDTPVRELIRRLDLFFGDPDNATVMVSSAMFYLSRETAKDPPEKLTKMLAAFRKSYENPEDVSVEEAAR